MRLVLSALLAAMVHGGAVGAPRAPSLAMPAALTGTVQKVVDGDTLHIVDQQGHRRIIRLSDVDAPETAHGDRRPGQPFAAEAAAFLRDRALGRQAALHCFDVDARRRADGTSRERYVCQVLVDGVDLNAALVDAGLAMVERWNPRYVRDRANYAREDRAREAHRGLWSAQHNVPPWTWRRDCWEHGICDAGASNSLARSTVAN